LFYAGSRAALDSECRLVFCDYFAGWFVFVEGTRGASVCVCGCCRCGGVFVARGYADRSLYAAVSVSRDEGVLKQQRMARIDHELQRAVAKIISEELKDPRLGFVTVTRTEITSDMMNCKVFVSIIGDRHVARQSMDALKNAAGFIRGELGAMVKLRYTPEVTFVEDRSTEEAIAMSKTLERAKVIDE
jgi:ribosome-binding factor A